MSENKDIQKVENDKDKIEYEKFQYMYLQPVIAQ